MNERTREILSYVLDNKEINIEDLKKEFNEEKDLECIKDVIFALAQNEAIANLNLQKFEIDFDKLEAYVKRMKLYFIDDEKCTINSIMDEYDKKTRLLIFSVLESLLEDAEMCFPDISIDEIRMINFQVEPTFKIKDVEHKKSYDPIIDLVMECYINDIIYPYNEFKINKDININKIESAIDFGLSLKVGKSDFYKAYQQIIKKKGKINVLEIFYNNNLSFSEGKVLIDYLENENKIKYIDKFNYEVISIIKEDIATYWRIKTIKGFLNIGFKCKELADNKVEIFFNKNAYIVEIKDTSIIVSLENKTKTLLKKYNDTFVKYLTDNTFKKKDVVESLLKMNSDFEFELDSINDIVHVVLGLDECIGIIKTLINNKNSKK